MKSSMAADDLKQLQLGLPEAGPGRPQPGRYSVEAIAQQRKVAALLRACRDQLSSMRDR